MSFEILLLRFEAGDVVRFDEPAVREALTRHGQPALVGAKYLTTRDGVDFELSRSDASDARNLSDPSATAHDELMLSMRGVSSGLFELVYDLAHGAQLTVIVPDEETAVLVADAGLIAHLPDAYAAKVVTVRSATELASCVLPIYERWRNWAH